MIDDDKQKIERGNGRELFEESSRQTRDISILGVGRNAKAHDIT